jgi:DNA-binding MarR family transcriptional regulator
MHMAALDKLGLDLCHCLALRQAARHVTQFYDRYLMQTGIRSTQYSILSKLARMDAPTVNALAEQMVMDRTTLGRNILPLERDGLIEIRRGREDRRSRELRLTRVGAARLRQATAAWEKAQRQFEKTFGGKRAADMRTLLQSAVATDLGPDSGGTTPSGARGS